MLSGDGISEAESVALRAIAGVVALDPGSVAWAQERDIEFRTFADLVEATTRDRFRVTAEDAAEALVRHVASAVRAASRDDVAFLPELDRTSLAQWLSFALALHEGLVRLLADTQHPVLVAVGASKTLPLDSGYGAFSSSLGDLVGQLFEASVVRIVSGPESATDAGPSPVNVSRSLRKRVRRTRDLLAAIAFHSVRRVSKVMVVAPVRHYEIRRHRHLWATLERDHRLGVIDIGGLRVRDRLTDIRLALKHSRRFGHRFHWMPKNREEPRTSPVFVQALAEGRKALDEHLNALAPDDARVTRSAVGVLASVLPSRWDEWAREWLFWRSVWRRSRPRAVIGVRNGVMDFLPLMAAGRSGIAAFSVGHGLAEHPSEEGWAPFQADSVTPLVPVEDPRPGPGGFEHCSGIVTRHEYEDSEGRRSAHDSPASGALVIVLCDSTALFDHGTLAAFGALDQVAEAAERCDDLVFALKEHPSKRIWQTICTQRGITALRLEDEMSDLFLLLSDASSVILLAGYWGSAAIHAVRSGLPVLRVRSHDAPSPGSRESQFWGPDLDAELPVAGRAEEICAFVRSAGMEPRRAVSPPEARPSASLSDRIAVLA